jgi:membrane dipeptidase
MAYNVQKGRDLTLSAEEIRAKEKREQQSCMVTLPDLRRGGVALVCGSIFVSPATFPETTDIEFDRKRAADAKEQVETYLGWERDGHARVIRSASSLKSHLDAWKEDGTPGVLIAMESSEYIESPEELGWWHEKGVRMIGTAWGPTRYCGGFAGARGQESGFTPLGRQLLKGMKELDIPLDLAHGSVAGWREGIHSDLPHVVCTHTVPRELAGRDRFPDAEMRGALSKRGGLIGIGLGNAFLVKREPESGAAQQVSIKVAGDLLEMLSHSTGWDHLGIGSDLDGGIGLEESPDELESVADIHKVGDNVPEDVRAGVLGGNWLRFFGEALPRD